MEKNGGVSWDKMISQITPRKASQGELVVLAGVSDRGL